MYKLFTACQTNKTEDPVVCIITGINGFLQKMAPDEKTNFTNLISEAAKLGNFKFVLVDTIDNIKAFNYETWFKSNVDLGEAIWVGNGISNQFTLKVTTSSRLLRVELEPNFGYAIIKGKAYVVKFLSEE